MATLEVQRPKPRHRSPSLHQAAPSSPSIIRTPDFILLPSVPTHEPEDNLPSPMALQHQFAMAQAQAQAQRSSSQNSLGLGSSSDEHHKDADELEEIVEPEAQLESDLNRDHATTSHDALRDLRNHQLESLQAIAHSIADSHLQATAASSLRTPHADVTQILDDMFASLRRIGGHNAPLSPTFSRPSVHHMSDLDRLVLLVDSFSQITATSTDAEHASQLARLNALTNALVESDRRIASNQLDSPPRTPRSLAWSESMHPRRSSTHQLHMHSPQSSSHLSGSRGSWSSTHSAATLSTSSDEAAPAPHKNVAALEDAAAAWSPRRSELLTQAGLVQPQPQQQHVDGSVFDMATIRTRTNPFSIESLYTREPIASSTTVAPAPRSPRSDQASRAASTIGDTSDSTATALPNRKRFSVQTDSAASTSLPSYSCDAPAYHADEKQKASAHDAQSTTSDGLPGYDASPAPAAFAQDAKKPLETPTLLERRRAKLAAQHSAYAARTPEDLAMVQSSIDRLSTVMPQLNNQRALSPEHQRQAQLDTIIGRLAHSNAHRLNDQRSEPPSFRPSRPAPSPHPTTTITPEPELPATPTTPVSLHTAPSASSSRRSSLLPGAFGRKLSIASIGNALRRASIYDASKLRSREGSESSTDGTIAAAAAPATRRRAATTADSRSKSDIAEGLTSLFNDGGKARKPSASDASAARLQAQSSFRAIDFADDTPRGRDASLQPRASVEEEDDSMLDDYSFATFDTQKSNHRLSVVAPLDSPRSPASWAASSSAGSRRSSQLVSSPATPTWPRSPLTPVSPAASRRLSKPAVTFAADTLAAPPLGKSTAASLQSQLRDSGFTPLRPGKSLASVAPPFLHEHRPPAAVSVSTTTAVSNPWQDIVCYSAVTGDESAAGDAKLSALSPWPHKSNTADPPARPSASAAPASTSAATRQSEPRVDVEFLAEAQPALGTVSVMLWTSTRVDAPLELAYELVAERGDVHSRRLRVWPVARNVLLNVFASESRAGGVEVVLPAAVRLGQSGRVAVGAQLSRVKLLLTEAEARKGAEASRAEGMVEFPLSARELSCRREGALGCAVCQRAGRSTAVLRWEEGGMEWRALPSEGWEELVDAWMCHGDQELNRSLTETAVKFSSSLHTSPSARVVWVGDTYISAPHSVLQVDVDGSQVSGLWTNGPELESRFSAPPLRGVCHGEGSIDTPLVQDQPFPAHLVRCWGCRGGVMQIPPLEKCSVIAGTFLHSQRGEDGGQEDSGSV